MKSKGSKNRKAKTDTRSSIYKSKLRQTKLPFAKVSWSGPANDLPEPSVASVDEQKPDAEEDSDDDIISPSSRRNSTKVRITSDLEEEDDADVTPKGRVVIDVTDEDDGFDSETVRDSSPTLPRLGTKRTYQNRIDEHFFPAEEGDLLDAKRARRDDVSDDDSDSEVFDGIQLAPKSSSSRRIIESEEEEEEDDETAIEEAEDEEGQDADNTEVEEEDSGAEESDILISPQIRRQRHLTSGDPDSDEPVDDLSEEELQDIKSSAKKSPVNSRIRDVKSRNRRKSAFQKALERLHRRKDDESETDTETDVGKPIYDTASDAGSVDSENFVVDDDEIPTADLLAEIPAQFTSMAVQGQQFNFKIVVQAEVFALLHPVYLNFNYSASDVDPYFGQAFKSLERQVHGLAESAVTSSRWKAWFVRALRSFPEFESEEFDGMRLCDGCEYIDKLARRIVFLTGPKYNPRTLEIIGENDEYCYWDDKDKKFLDDLDPDDEALQSKDVQRRRLKKPDGWGLGIECYRRCKVAHYFYHWRYHLREQVKTALRYVGWWNDEKKAYIASLSLENQNETLGQVMDLLEKKRHIRRLYEEHRNRVSGARAYLGGEDVEGWDATPRASRFVRR